MQNLATSLQNVGSRLWVVGVSYYLYPTTHIPFGTACYTIVCVLITSR